MLRYILAYIPIALFTPLTVLNAQRPLIIEADLCVYGGTSGGTVAAVQAARMGKTVIIEEPGKHLGGMTSGGLSAVDIGDPRSVGGLAREYFTRLVAKYGKKLEWDQPFKSNGGTATGGAYAIEPHLAERVFDEMVMEAGVKLIHEGKLSSGRDNASPYAIGYESIIPRRSECENLFAPFALSASHTAFASIRIEPVFMCLSQSAATASVLAMDVNQAVQDVGYNSLMSCLLRDKQVLAWPPL